MGKRSSLEFINQINKLKDERIIDYINSELVFIIEAPYPNVIALFEIWESERYISFVIDEEGRKINRNKTITQCFKYKDKNGIISNFKTKTLDKMRKNESFDKYIPFLKNKIMLPQQ